MRAGTVAAWGTLTVGALGQAALEILAPSAVPTRALAIVLVAVLAAGIADRSMRYRRLRRAAVAVACALGVPLWVSHGVAAMRAYGIDSVEAAALNPAILMTGALLVHLLGSDEPAEGR